MLVSTLYACGGERQVRETADLAARHKQVATRFYETFRSGDVQVLDSILSDDFVDHSDSRDQGRDSLKYFIQTVYAHKGGLRSEIVRQVADSNYVFTWLRYAATEQDLNASQTNFDMQSIGVALFREGQIIEHWEFANVQDLVQMAAARMPAVDTVAVR